MQNKIFCWPFLMYSFFPYYCRTCEICGTTALNVAGEQTNEATNAVAAPAASTTAGFSEPQTYWQGRRIMNLLFGCMVLAFVISWLLHFKVFP